MSREHKDPMVMLLEAMFGDGAPKCEPKKEAETPPTETKGFKSLVTKEEYEAIVKIKEAVDNYIDVHNRGVFEHARNRDGLNDSYASIQYLFLSDMIEDAMGAIGAMYTIHSFNKDMIDEVAREDNLTVKELEKKLVFESMMRKLKG